MVWMYNSRNVSVQKTLQKLVPGSHLEHLGGSGWICVDLGGFRKIHGQPPGHAKKYYGIRVRTGIKFKLLGPKGTALEFAPKLN